MDDEKDKYSWVYGTFTNFFSFKFRNFKDRIHAESLVHVTNSRLAFGTDYNLSFQTIDIYVTNIIKILKENRVRFVLFREFRKNDGKTVLVNASSKDYEKHWGKRF
jgi:hypothetical protein